MSITWDAVADRVKRRRLELGLSQRRAAIAADVSPTTWASMETHQNPINDITKRGVARALLWPTDWYDRMLAGESDDELLAAYEAARPSSRIVSRDYNSDIAQLPPDAQEFIDQVIDREIRKQQG